MRTLRQKLYGFGIIIMVVGALQQILNVYRDPFKNMVAFILHLIACVVIFIYAECIGDTP